MPHLRERFISKIIEAKLKFAPVFALQGARQTGKSYLAREVIGKKVEKAIYLTFDQKALRSFAEKRPDTFLDTHSEYKPIIIDEAQKVPDIFDAIKFRVDEKRTPGQFFLLGSTEFSKLTNIRESLTGRMSRARLYPLTLRESLSRKQVVKADEFFLVKDPEVTRSEFLRYLKSGGLPGIFTVKNKSEKDSLLRDWIALTVERDIHTFEKSGLSSELALEILELIARLEEPSLANISKVVKSDIRIIKSHLDVLKTLFVINTLSPHKSGSGKELYFILDTAIASTLGASFERLLCTTVLNELLAKFGFMGDSSKKLYYYRTARGSRVDFLIEDQKGSVSLLKIIYDEKYDEREFNILTAYRKKYGEGVKLFALAPFESLGSKEQVKVYKWESIA